MAPSGQGLLVSSAGASLVLELGLSVLDPNPAGAGPATRTPRGCTGSPSWVVRGENAWVRAVHLWEPASQSLHLRHVSPGSNA